jgi:hypothetical protein
LSYKPQDIFGNEIEVGNTIAYCIAWGRGQRQAVYTVLEILDGKILAKQVHSSRTYTNSRNSRLQDPENRAVKLWLTFEENKK